MGAAPPLVPLIGVELHSLGFSVSSSLECWTTDHGVPGSNPTFSHPSFRDGFLFPLLKKSKSGVDDRGHRLRSGSLVTNLPGASPFARMILECFGPGPFVLDTADRDHDQRIILELNVSLGGG